MPKYPSDPLGPLMVRWQYLPKAIAELAKEYTDNPAGVAAAPVATTADRVGQGGVLVPTERKRDLLVMLLRDPVPTRVLVFIRTKHGADRLVRHLLSLMKVGLHSDRHGERS